MSRRLSALCVAAAIGLSDAAGEASAQLAAPLDSVRLLTELSVLAHDSMQGRSPGTPGSLRARTFLVRAMRESGAEPVGDGYRHAFERTRGRGERRGENIVGMVAGSGSSDQVIVLTAHYDHLGVRSGQIFNGADDNASGTAALLELARQLSASPLNHAVVVALVDQEERGSWGSRAIVVDELVPLERIALNVNLDMVSRTDGVLWAGGAHHTPGLRPILDEVAALAPVTLRQGHDRPGAPEGADWTLSSDHAAFHEVGIPYVYFGVEDHQDYHRSTDDFERIDPGEYLAAVRTIMIAIRALDAALPLQGPGSE